MYKAKNLTFNLDKNIHKNIAQNKSVIKTNIINDSNSKETSTFNNNIIKKIYIFTNRYTLAAALELKNYFIKINILCSVIEEFVSEKYINLCKYNNDLILFIFAPQWQLTGPLCKVKNLPKNQYILYQVEQLNQTEHIYQQTSIIKNYIKNSLYTFDYSKENLSYYEDDIQKFIKILPPFISEQKIISQNTKSIDILFIGTLNNRRKKILNYLIEKKYNIKIVEKTFGTELYDLIKKSKIILNLHCYNNSIFELFRIHEILPFNCQIISEDTNLISEKDLLHEYLDIIKFCPVIDDNLSNINLLLNIINITLRQLDILLYSENINSNKKNFIINNNNNNFDYLKIIFTSYTTLFNKYHLNIAEYNKDLLFEIIQDNKNINFSNQGQEYYAHLHCYNIDDFYSIYGSYISTISKIFQLVITYCVGDNISLDSAFILLKINNKGMDIGAKFNMVEYLNNKNCNYKYILFLHSKTNKYKRDKYFTFIKSENINWIQEKMNELTIDGIFPDIPCNGDWMSGQWYTNKNYTEELLSLLNCKNSGYEYYEGNCMILSKRIVDKIFVENKKLLYNILNDKNSFDINWFNWYYKPDIKNYKELYEIFVKYNLIGNNLNNPNTTMISKNLDYNSFFNKALGNVQFPDAMIEHAFERIYLSVIKSFPDGKYIDLSMKKDINCKNDFRRICLDNIPIIRNIIIPKIEKFIKNETVYIEFRIFDHAEYLIRNMLIKLPTWSHTVICGNQNYYHLKEICNNISDNIRIIKLDIDNLNTAQYSDLLMTKSFWNNFYGEKILLYQEDSYIFHNQIEPFLNYDWVGAPWPIHQDENINQRKYGVGNGGFSLRSKSKMIECIEKVNWKTDLILGPQLKQYMKDTNNYIIPEDVFFSKCLLEKNIGLVAPRKVAQHFSQETQPGINPLGGHNFYLANKSLSFGISKIKNKIGIYSPFNYTIGGGEFYISCIMRFFINLNYEIYYFNDTQKDVYEKTKRFYFQNKMVKINLIPTQDIKLYNNYFDYFIEMSNNKEPLFVNNKFATKQIFHCQFPHDIKLPWKNSSINYLDCILLNSDFTKKYYHNCSYGKINSDKIHILYPLLENIKSDNNNINKIKNSFIVIGRIFRPHFAQNNKHHNYIIDIFNLLNESFDYTLNIIGSCKDVEYLNILKNKIKNPNKIKIHPDIDNEKKIEFLKQSEYLIHACGAENSKDSIPSSEEHFGIAIIEGLNNNCIPICANRGYPPYYIKNNENGYLFNNFSELGKIIQNILENKTNINSNILKQNLKFSNTFCIENYNSILSNIILTI